MNYLKVLLVLRLVDILHGFVGSSFGDVYVVVKVFLQLC